MVSISEIIKERYKTVEESIINKVKDIKIAERTFKTVDGDSVNYKQLVLVVVVNGNLVEVPLSLKNDKALVLQAAQELEDEDFLPENDKK